MQEKLFCIPWWHHIILITKCNSTGEARYTLENTALPIGISEYELTELYPKDMKSSLPSIQDIENELKEK